MATILRPVETSMHGREIGLSRERELIVKGEPDQVTITATPGASNITLVSIQAVDNEGFNYPAVLNATVWLSDAASGAGLTATTPNTAAVGAAGVSLGTLTTGKALAVQTNTLGLYILSITDTGKTGFFVCARLEAGRKVRPITKQVTTLNYG